MAVYGRSHKQRVKVELSDDDLDGAEDVASKNLYCHRELGRYAVLGESKLQLLRDHPTKSVRMQRSPKKAILEASFSNDITTSPQRYTRFVNSIVSGPESPMVSPMKSSKVMQDLMKEDDRTKRKLDFSELKRDEEKTKKMDFGGELKKPKLSKVKKEVKKTKVKSPPSAFDNLFDDIDEDTPSSNTITFSVKSDLDSDAEESPQTELPTGFEEMFDFTIPEAEEKRPETKPKSVYETDHKTYGAQRSYLAEESEPAAEEEDHSHDMISNSIDLRTLGRLNSIKGHIEYLSESLVLKKATSKPIESENRLLIMTLLDIIEMDIGSASDQVAQKLISLSAKTYKGTSEGEKLIWQLLCLCMHKLAKAGSKVSDANCRYYNFQTLNIESLKLPPTLKRSLKSTLSSSHIEKVIAELQVETLQHSFTLPDIAKMVDIYPTDPPKVLQYLVEYFSQSLPLNESMCEGIRSILNQEFSYLRNGLVLKVTMLFATMYHLLEKVRHIAGTPEYLQATVSYIGKHLKMLKKSGWDASEASHVIYGAAYVLHILEGSETAIEKRRLEVLADAIETLDTYTESMQTLAGYCAMILNKQKLEMLPNQKKIVTEHLEKFLEVIDLPEVKKSIELEIQRNK